jgi:hypothetical protein
MLLRLVADPKLAPALGDYSLHVSSFTGVEAGLAAAAADHRGQS